MLSSVCKSLWVSMIAISTEDMHILANPGTDVSDEKSQQLRFICQPFSAGYAFVLNDVGSGCCAQHTEAT
uniref:Uncharacterized protein n=1 Tax=Arundo donax TaxID=35708 RepID=A0A0A9FHD0_ARUDO